MTVHATGWLLLSLCASPGQQQPVATYAGVPSVERLVSRLDGLKRELERSTVRDADDVREETLRRHASGLLAALSNHRLPTEQRERAVEQLVATGPKGLALLLERLGTSNAQERVALNQVIPRFGSAATPELLRLLDSPDIVTRRWAAYLLGEIRDPAAVEPLLSLAGAEDWHVRLYVAYALGQIGDPGGCAALIELVGDTEPNVRRNAAHGLQQVVCPAATEALGKALADTHYGVRRAAAAALVEAGEGGAARLIDAATDTRPEVRHTAMEALGWCQDERVLPVLLEALKSEDWADRGFAASALAQLGDEGGLEPLRAALPAEKHPFARARIGAAHRTLARKIRRDGP
jgi:HEAT repeat protein